MTTKLQSSINLVTRAPLYYHLFISIRQLYPEPQACLHRSVSSMDRILDCRSIESMRKMMVLQEQVFRQQVEELHRLYSLQKKLMNDVENGLKKRKEVTSVAERSTNSPKELSGSNSVESSRMLINFDLEMPAERSRSSVRDLKMIQDEQVDLTLSIGHSTMKQRSKSTQLQDLNSNRT